MILARIAVLSASLAPLSGYGGHEILCDTTVLRRGAVSGRNVISKDQKKR